MLRNCILLHTVEGFRYFRVFRVSHSALTGIGHVCGPHDASDLLHVLQVRRQAAVAAEDLLVDDGGDRQTVEAVGEQLP